MVQSLVGDAVEFVKNIFRNDFGGHDYFHTLRVYKMATTIAEREGADVKIVQLAALLHDVDDIKLSPETHENLQRAVDFLRAHSASEEDITTICQIIREVSFKGTDSAVPATLEGKCVQDADRIDAIGAIGIARTFAYGGSHDRVMYDPDEPPVLHMNAEEYRKHVSTTINHFYEKLFLLRDMMNTPTAKKIAARRDEYMKAYIAEFMDEWDGIC